MSNAAVKPNGAPKKEETVDLKVVEILPVKELKSEISVEQIATRTSQLNALFERREKLLGSRAKLELFKMGADDINTSVNFKDNSGNNWATSNAQVIRRMLKIVSDELESSQLECESLIRATFE